MPLLNMPGGGGGGDTHPFFLFSPKLDDFEQLHTSLVTNKIFLISQSLKEKRKLLMRSSLMHASIKVLCPFRKWATMTLHGFLSLVPLDKGLTL